MDETMKLSSLQKDMINITKDLDICNNNISLKT